MSAARVHAPLRAPRRRKPPMVGSRIAGHRYAYDGYSSSIYNPRSSSGELGDAYWYRMREEDRVSRADAWRVAIYTIGAKLFLDAVVDDFGDLVVVQQ
jgi:hypothetical protein